MLRQLPSRRAVVDSCKQPAEKFLVHFAKMVHIENRHDEINHVAPFTPSQCEGRGERNLELMSRRCR